ncbi:hypothetical protein D9M72_439170 [compost metagenome]
MGIDGVVAAPDQLDFLRGLGIGAAQQRAHARDQLAGADGLEHVVVGADAQAGDDVGLAGTAGDKQDRWHVAGLLAHPADQFIAAGAGQLPVHHQQVKRPFAQRAQEIGAIGERFALETGLAQNLPDQLGLIRIVLHRGNSHPLPLPTATAIATARRAILTAALISTLAGAAHGQSHGKRGRSKPEVAMLPNHDTCRRGFRGGA